MSKIPPKAVLAILGAFLYGASPVDLIPDIIPVVGYLDDALIVPLLLFLAYLQIRKMREKSLQPIPIRRGY